MRKRCTSKEASSMEQPEMSSTPRRCTTPSTPSTPTPWLEPLWTVTLGSSVTIQLPNSFLSGAGDRILSTPAIDLGRNVIHCRNVQLSSKTGPCFAYMPSIFPTAVTSWRAGRDPRRGPGDGGRGADGKVAFDPRQHISGLGC